MKFVKKILLLWILFSWSFSGVAQIPAELTIPASSNDPVVLKISNREFQTSGARPLVFNEHSVARQFLSVYVDHGPNIIGNDFSDDRAIQGQYVSKNGKLSFTPDFPFMQGQAYIIRIMPVNSVYRKQNASAKKTTFSYLYTTFTIEYETQPPVGQVIDIYPTSSNIAENVLRFYLYFSTPMKRQVALRHIKLIDDNGNQDTHAFMRFKQELWSPDGKRLTLLLDPGRIKRNVATNQKLGPALIAGKYYQLIIDKNWQTADGQSLKQHFIKQFFVQSALRTLPNPELWQITPPTVHSNEVLNIHFDRVYDHALVKKFIRVTDLDNNPIYGEVQLADQEKTWIFKPEQPWQALKIQLLISAELEDIAGNNLQDLLDHSVDEGSKDIDVVKLVVTLKQ